MRDKRELLVSVTSSFDTTHFERSPKAWPHKIDCSYVEVYAFMHNCLAEIFPKATETSALVVLAEAWQTDSEIGRVANLLDQHFDEKKIIAITSFLPEILSPERSNSWIKAQNALKFLVSVTATLKNEYQHPCSTLVMAGGSCYAGMWEGRDIDDDRVIVVNRLPRSSAIPLLVERLGPVAEHASKLGIRLAISMEPGPLYAIGDWKSIKDLCAAIESCKNEYSHSIKSAVGLNLDIAHWAFLADIRVEWIHQNPKVKRRIIHAHISDHDKGHCSDAGPETFHLREDFAPWIELLKELSANTSGENPSLYYSGYLSCEHEAACKVDIVSDSLRTIRSWV